MDQRIIEELKESYNELAESSNLKVSELGELFKRCGEPQPAFKIRDLIERKGFNNSDAISFELFIELFQELGINKTTGAKFRQGLGTKSGLTVTSGAAAEGTVHSVADSERHAFSQYINRILKKDEHVQHLLPISSESVDDLFKKLGDGIILCKLVNSAVPNTIDVRTINLQKLNAFKITENLNLALNSCRAIGIHVVNIGSQDIIDGTPHLALGLLWQVIRIILFAHINLKDNPNLVCLLEEGETLDMLLSMPPEDILLRWVNFQLKKTNCSRVMTNYSGDIKDSEIYAHLLNQICPESVLHNAQSVLAQSDVNKRADLIIENADACESTGLLLAQDITTGHHRLNLAFVANLFNNYPCLDEAEEVEVIEETREEKTYRNWMNSLGANPKVNYLYSDLNTGLIYFFLFELIKPGIVNWDKVNKPPFKLASANIKKAENCSYVVDLGKELKFSLVGIGGSDLAAGHKTFTLALLAQMLRSYTLKVLQDLSSSTKAISDPEIIEWANSKTSTKIQSFKDPAIHTSLPLIELINAISPNSINQSYVLPGNDEEEKLKNAMYAISMARKIGARVYALPEDIVEGKFKMILTIYACLMARDLAGHA